MTRGYFINPLAILFHPELDKRNNYKTIARNPETEEVLKVNAFGYDILKTIEENPSFDVESISQVVAKKRNLAEWQIETKIAKFMQLMVGENIIFEK